MAKKRPRAYPAEFRLNNIELARHGRRVEELASEFNLGTQTVRNWLKQADVDAGRRSDGLTSADREEVAKLRKRVRDLEIERAILSKAYARMEHGPLVLTHVKSSVPLPAGQAQNTANVLIYRDACSLRETSR